MAKLLQVGNQTFEYPEQGTELPWGEDATGWAEAVTEALQTVQGPNDKLKTEVTLANNQTTPTDISGLSFNVAAILAVTIEYYVERIYDGGATQIGESGVIRAYYDGTDFNISVQATEDAGVDITATNAGQFQYTSDNKANHTSSRIVFTAKTIDV